MAYFLDDNNPDIIVIVNRQSSKIPERFDRVVWSKTEKKFIYGDTEEYMVRHGDNDDIWLDTDVDTQKINKDSYKTGLTQCGSSFYDDGKKLYEMSNLSAEHKLLFDASKIDEDGLEIIDANIEDEEITAEEYIVRMQCIRRDIETLIDELWQYPENKEAFNDKEEFSRQIISDILNGYELE